MRRAAGTWVVLALLVALPTGCSSDDATRSDVAPTAAPTTPTAPPTPAAATPGSVVVVDPLIGRITTAPDVVAAVQQVLDDRAAAVLTGDADRFREGVAPRAPVLAQQEQYFTNLRQLPLQVLTLVADPATLVRSGAAYDVNVAVTMQLAGFDAVPVTSLDRYRFVPARGGRAGYRLASVTDAAWEARNGVRGQPWDDRPVQVRAGDGVLAVLDDASAAAAGPLVASVAAGIADVGARVPYDWSRTVVVYALSDDAFLRGIPDLPGGDPDELDAVAFPVTADAAQPASALAGTRLVLHPRVLARTGATRDRLIRHELAHAAVGTHDDHAPVWLQEGLAEQVSVQAQASADRRISERVLAAARAGFTDLPADDGFNDADAAVHYGLAWWACEHVAAVAGPPAVWSLLDQLEALGAAGTLDHAAQDDVLGAVAGVSSRALARKAGKLVLATFEPPPLPTPLPTPGATPAPTGAPGIDPLPGQPSSPVSPTA